MFNEIGFMWTKQMSLESKTLYTTKEEIHYEISSHRLKYREGTPTTIHAYFFQLIGGQVLAHRYVSTQKLFF